MVASCKCSAPLSICFLYRSLSRASGADYVTNRQADPLLSAKGAQQQLVLTNHPHLQRLHADALADAGRLRLFCSPLVRAGIVSRGRQSCCSVVCVWCRSHAPMSRPRSHRTPPHSPQLAVPCSAALGLTVQPLAEAYNLCPHVSPWVFERDGFFHCEADATATDGFKVRALVVV